MADFGSPVAQTVNPVGQGMQTLSDVMNFKRQQQALQTGVYQQQTAQANAQQDQQKNQELQSLAQFTKKAAQDPAYHNPDGSLNVQKYQTDAMAAAPTYGQAYIGQMTGNANAMVDNRKALLGLSNEQRSTIGNYFAGVAAKPNATREDFLDAAEQARSVSDDPQYQRSVDRMLMSAPDVRTMPTEQASGAIRQWSRSIAQETSAPGAAASDPAVQMIQGPGGLVPTNVNPQAPGGVQPVGPTQQQGVAPGANVLTDAYGRQFVLNPQNNQVAPVGAGRGSAQPTQPNAPQFAQPIPGQADAQASIEATRKADADYGLNRHVNDQILRLSKDTATGPGTDIWHHVLGGIAGPGGGNNVADYQTIGAYLDRQAALSAKQMGLPDTNAGLATAASLSGTTNYQPKALQTKVKLTDALVEGAHQYREGLDKAVGTGPNQDLSKYQAFRGAWAANFDPNIYRVENALKRGDKDELAQIKKEAGPQGMAELKRKSDNLRLLEQGKIPP